MSVRPITVGEETKAFAHPWINIFSFFGATQGMITYLHRTRIPFQSNWLAAPGSPVAFAIFVLGGYLIGGGVAMAAFTDWDLVRIAKMHQKDRVFNTDGQSIKNLQ